MGNIYAPQGTEPNAFDMARLSHAKRAAGVSPNTVRKWHREYGLRIYWVGKAAFFSLSELHALIRTVSSNCPPRRKAALQKEAA